MKWVSCFADEKRIKMMYVVAGLRHLHFEFVYSNDRADNELIGNVFVIN